MTSNPIFRGVATALITPLNESGIDFSAFARLIDWQIAEGVAALVIAGTTGEGSTLTDEEHRAAVRFAVEHTAGRVPVIAGTGSNDIIRLHAALPRCRNAQTAVGARTKRQTNLINQLIIAQIPAFDKVLCKM